MRNRLLMPLLLLSTLPGCLLGPDHLQPQSDLPSGWMVPAADSAAATVTPTIDPHWWHLFDDPALTALIEEALQHNADLSVAAARIAEARALLNLRDAERYPLLSGQADASRQQGSAETAQPGGGVIHDALSVSAVLNYELDLWGRLARANEAAQAQLLASVASRDAIALAVSADIASGYFNLRALDQQLLVARNTVKTREGSYRFQESRYRNGATSQLVFRQAESELAAARAELPALEQQRTLQINALSVLLGRTPRELVQQTITTGHTLDELPPLPEVPMGLPSTLLQRRPDILAAEQQLRAANAEIGIAHAAYFPRLSLTGLFGNQSDDLSNLFNGSAKNWQFAGNLTGPIIDFGRTQATVEAAEARRQQALINYQQTVRTAFREVLDALKSRSASSERLAAQSQQVAALQQTARLAQRRFEEGYSDYLEVLDAQRSLFNVELARINTQQQGLRALVQLYKALGGGWQPDATPPHSG